MSQCTCVNKVHCECTISKTPQPGLKYFSRQWKTFADFRGDMKALVPNYSALDGWEPCTLDDWGLIIIDMWAYVADVQNFYDQVFAHELYLTSAKRRLSITKLTSLLGYKPKPAVAASAYLKVMAQGTQLIKFSKGLAFRSAAFDEEPPQVFEVEADVNIHSSNNDWRVDTEQLNGFSSDSAAGADVEVDAVYVNTKYYFRSGDVVLFKIDGESAAYHQSSKIQNVLSYTDSSGKKLNKLDLSSSIDIPNGTLSSNVQIYRANLSQNLWKQSYFSGDPKAVDGNQIVLDTLSSKISANDELILSYQNEYKYAMVESNSDTQLTIQGATSQMVEDAEGNDVPVPIPALKSLSSKILLDRTIDNGSWVSANANAIKVYYSFQKICSLELPSLTDFELDTSVHSTLPLNQPLVKNKLAPDVQQVFIQDSQDEALRINATLDYDSTNLDIGQAIEHASFVPPLTIFGNLVKVSRGESVEHEVLGSGLVTEKNQIFTLKKKPLTYLNNYNSASEQGIESTLKVYVNGVAWDEVDNFYNTGPTDQVFVVTHDEDENTFIQFGDGNRGARLPSGVDNIIAYYRFGAGKSSPPKNTINQMVQPINGVTSVTNPIASTGGSEREDIEDIQLLAPQSSLLLGRAISIEDMAVVARSVAGVSFAHASWQWQDKQQRAMVCVWILADEATALPVKQKIRSLSHDNLPFSVEVIKPFELGLSLDVSIDDKYITENVLSDIYQILLSDTGLLTPEKMGFGRALFRSQIFEVLHSVSGVMSVNSISLLFYGWTFPWNSSAIKAPTGFVWDFINAGVKVNGKYLVPPNVEGAE